MDNRDKFFKLMEKYEAISKTPYIDQNGIDNTVKMFEKFVNQFDTREMFALAAKVAIGEDQHVVDYMKKMNISFPKDHEEAVDRGLDLVGVGLSKIHRTLNQNFMRVCLAFIEIMAAKYEAGLYDARNENSCRLCYAIQCMLNERKDVYLPMV